MPIRIVMIALAAVSAAFAACSAPAARTGPSPSSGPADAAARTGPAALADDPTARFEAMEAWLLDTAGVSLRYAVTAEGAFSAAMEGTLRLAGSGRVELRAEGTFGGAPVRVDLVSDGERMTGGSAARRFDEPSPAELHAALVLGLTRMGIMHNLARLTAGQPPDRAAGGVREWVQALDVTYAVAPPGAAPGGAGPDAGPGAGLRFGIRVGGVDTAEATLWLHPGTGLPLRREQTVNFPGGSMLVVERYDFDPQDR